METFSRIERTGKQAIRNGLLLIVWGILLIILGQQLPRLAYQLFFLYVFVSSLWQLLSRWFRPQELRENLWITGAKLVLASLLANTLWTENLTVYLLVFAVAFYQIFIAFVNMVTWWLYRQNEIRPRWRYWFDGLWMGSLGFYSLSPWHDAANFQFLLLGGYLIALGLTNLRDGFFFEASLSEAPVKRRVRVSLPIFLTALVPAATLNKLNEFMQDHEGSDAPEVYDQQKAGKTAQLEVFIHTAQTSLFSAIGHVDLCYQGRVISYGNYDPASERFVGMVGDGVLYHCEREAYIDLCKRESQKTLFGYGLSLTPQQEAAVQERLAEIDNLLVPWQPDVIHAAKDGTESETYAHKIQTQAAGELFKFKQSKFKTYFVLSTNCVLLADSIVGQAGTDIVSPKGFIAPGTYQTYLDEEYAKPHSLVVSKKVY